MKINPIGRQNLQFRRKTTRYGKNKGSFSSNQGYLSVARDSKTGQFVSRKIDVFHILKGLVNA